MHVNSSKLWIFVNNQTVQQSRFRREYPDFAWKSRILANTRSGRIGNISISTRVVLFSSNSHKKRTKCRILNSDITKNWRNCKSCDQTTEDFWQKRTPEISLGGMPPEPPSKGCSVSTLKTVSLKKFYPDLSSDPCKKQGALRQK